MEWALGTYKDDYFLFIVKGNKSIVIDIGKQEALRIIKEFDIKEVEEYPF